MLVDAIVVAILVLAIAAGLARGFFASVGTLVGLVAGGLGAYWLAPIAVGLIPAAAWRGIAITGGTLLLLGLGAALGSGLGELVRRGVDRTPLRALERVLGGVAGLVIASLAVSMAATGIAGVGIPGVSAAVGSSRVVRAIDALIPAPVEATLARVRGAVLGGGLPVVGALLAPGTAAPVAPVDLADPAVRTASQSVGRISGVAYACGRSVTGSGFVVAPDRVLTNAHVVAGVSRPVVELPGRGAADGTVVWFDPERDIALIAVATTARPLPQSATLAPGAAGVVAGYPFGGPLSIVDAQVLSVGSVSVADIYDRAPTPRELYALAAEVQPGNSGGPLLTASGAVAGIVVARDEKQPDRGYAMTAAEYGGVIAQAEQLRSAVSTGACAP